MNKPQVPSRQMLEIINESQTEIRIEPLEKVALRLCELEIPKQQVQLSILLCDSDKMRKLNRIYRGLDETTDVLSFKADIPVLDGSFGVRGDIVVDINQAENQRGTNSLETELQYLVIHGLLHLLGHDHIKRQDQEIMEHKEQYYRKTLTGAC